MRTDAPIRSPPPASAAIASGTSISQLATAPPSLGSGSGARNQQHYDRLSSSVHIAFGAGHEDAAKADLGRLSVFVLA